MITKMYSKDDFGSLLLYVENIVENRQLPCAVLGIASRNEVIGIDAFGTWPNKKRLKTDDIFLLFSATKPIVALAVMKLWEHGNLHLHEPVIKYIPEFAANGKENITIWNLLTHTSGMNQKIFERILIEKPAPVVDIYKEIVNAEIDDPCGSKKVYNNLAFSVLGEIIRRVSGTDYDKYMKENIFLPLGMKDTFFFSDDVDWDRVVPIVNPFEMNVESFYKGKYPAGALFSTAADLVILAQALLNNGLSKRFRLLNAKTLQSMTTPQTIGLQPFEKVDFNGVETGLGWLLPMRSHSIIYRELYGHHGAAGSMFWVYPKDGLVLVFLGNQVGSITGEFQWEYILNVFSSCLT